MFDIALKNDAHFCLLVSFHFGYLVQLELIRIEDILLFVTRVILFAIISLKGIATKGAEKFSVKTVCFEYITASI